jgi:hypothetical protein
LREVEFGPAGQPKHTLHHLQTLHWVDGDVPEPRTAIKAAQMKDHLAKKWKGPLHVHCMAGVGRTPTQGIIDELYYSAWSSHPVDVFAAVKSQRSPAMGRTPHQVSLQKQYRFIYVCLDMIRKQGREMRAEMKSCIDKRQTERVIALVKEAPTRWQGKVYGTLYTVAGKPANVPHNYGELAFNGSSTYKVSVEDRMRAVGANIRERLIKEMPDHLMEITLSFLDERSRAAAKRTARNWSQAL